MAKIGIVTDSSADLPLSFYEDKKDVIMLPLFVRYGMEALMDWHDISPELEEDKRRYTINEFYTEMACKKHVPYTIPVNVGRLISAYEKLAETCDTIISIHFSHHLGFTVKAAEIAAQKFSKCKVIVIDTLQISNGYGIIIDEAIKRRDQGMNIDQLEVFIKNTVQSLNAKLFMTNKSSLYLYRCHRMNLFIFLLANLIKLKSFTIKDGKITPLFSHLGNKGIQKALTDISLKLKEAKNAGKEAYAVISHANNGKEALAVQQFLQKSDISCKIRYLGLITGVYGGPGTYAIMPVILDK